MILILPLYLLIRKLYLTFGNLIFYVAISLILPGVPIIYLLIYALYHAPKTETTETTKTPKTNHIKNPWNKFQSEHRGLGWSKKNMQDRYWATVSYEINITCEIKNPWNKFQSDHREMGWSKREMRYRYWSSI
jgi:hypothetical protein